MKFEIGQKTDDPQRILALANIARKYYLNAEEINQIIIAIAYLLGTKTTLYKEEWDDLFSLEQAWPNPEPGSYAQIRVVDGPNLRADWDNTDKVWRITGDWRDSEYASNSQEARINFFNSGYKGGLSYNVSAAWEFPGYTFGSEVDPIFQKITLESDPDNPRIGVIVLNSDGSITKKLGVPSANPSKPDLDPNTELEGTFVLIQAGAQTPDGVNIIRVYDENTGIAGGEFATTEDTEGLRINLASEIDKTEGTKAIEATKTKYYDTITFTPENPIVIAEVGVSEFNYDFRNKPSTDQRDIFVRFRGEDENGNIKVKTLIPSAYDPLSEEWQFISMSLAKLNFPILTAIDLVANPRKQDDFGFFVDNVFFPTGTESVSNSNDYVSRSELDAYALKDLSNLLATLTEADKNLIKQKLGIEGTGGAYVPPNPYANVQAMFDDQANQTLNQSYRVTDASGWSTVNGGRAWFTYLGTTSQNKEDDYEKRSEEESMDLDQQFAALQAAITALEGRVLYLEENPSSGASNDVWGVKPTGAIDGVNKIFTLPQAYQAGKLRVFRNGIRQTKPDDFTETSDTTFEFVIPPVNDYEPEKILTDFTPK